MTSAGLDDPACAPIATAQTVDGDHDRIESRSASVSSDIDWLQSSSTGPVSRPSQRSSGPVRNPGKTTHETAYYLLSTALTGERRLEVVRAHWGVENRRHWRLDVVMNEDQQRNRSGNGPTDLAALRHMALNVMQKTPPKARCVARSGAPAGMSAT